MWGTVRLAALVLSCCSGSTRDFSMIGGQIRPLAARALACAVRRRCAGGVAAAGHEEEVAAVAPRRPHANRMVAAAFAQLRPNVEDRISEASGSVERLLAVAADPSVRREHALKIVAALAERAAADGATATAKFESDPRFVRLCQMLGQQAAKEAANKNDLATILSVAADDEAARMAHSLSLEQAVKVMSTLASKKRRPVPLLHALAANLSKQDQVLSVKQASNLLYAMASLNFPDEPLLDKIQMSLLENLAKNEYAAPVGSALTSIGILKYRDSALLDALSEWVVSHSEQYRPQDLVSFLLTLAHMGYEPVNMEVAVSTVMERLQNESPAPSAWLDAVWALAVLGRLQPSLATSVLEPSFDKEALGPGAALKLQQVHAAASLELKDFSPPPLEATPPPPRPKSKETLVKSVLDAMKNLFPNQGYLKTQHDSGMGFLVDGECQVDARGNPLPLDKPPPPRTKPTRLAIMVWEYNDMCRRVREPTGPNKLAVRLLEAQGLRVLQVPHYEFSPNEKLVQRVQYLERKIKAGNKKK